MPRSNFAIEELSSTWRSRVVAGPAGPEPNNVLRRREWLPTPPYYAAPFDLGFSSQSINARYTSARAPGMKLYRNYIATFTYCKPVF